MEDEINDEFFGKGENIKEFQMSVYDRWGNLLFYGGDISQHWIGNVRNGTEIAQQDVYVYIINIKDNMNTSILAPLYYTKYMTLQNKTHECRFDNNITFSFS